MRTYDALIAPCKVFDLKGSLRNRNVKTDSGKESCEVVLLDENLLKLIYDNPLYIRSHCKSVLRAAIHSDAYFLSSHLIIDYSLLVGRDDTTDQLVVGIIGKKKELVTAALKSFLSQSHTVSTFTDYIRTFTWDKKLEMVVKSTGILGGQGSARFVLNKIRKIIRNKINNKNPLENRNSTPPSKF